MDANEKNIYIAILTGSIITGFILVYFLFSILRQHKKKKELQEESMQNLLRAIEKERSRISNDLHDEINPLLAAIKYHINSIKLKVNEGYDELDSTNKYINDVITSLTAISYDLMPVMLIRNKVTKAIEEYVSTINRRKQIQIIFTNKTTEEISQHIGVHLFRIIQEIIQNTIKHSQSELLYLELISTESYIQFISEDKGIGFDKNLIYDIQNGKGLKSIQLRIELLKGKCQIISAINEGTKIIINLPKQIPNEKSI